MCVQYNVVHRGRKLLIVISDGAPVDDSTLSVNLEGLLSAHLATTSQWLSQQRLLTLFGVGIEHEIKTYYENGIVVTDASGIGIVVLKSLPNLLLGKSPR